MTLAIDSKRGVTVNYGTRKTNGALGSHKDTRGLVKTLEYVFDYDNLPTYGSNNLQASIPAYAKVISSRFEILTAFTSTSTTTDLNVGLYTSAGAEIDADGLHTAAQLTQTAIATRGLFYTGAGALVGVSIGAAAGEVVVAPTVADLLTGKARLIIEYIEEGV